MVFFRLFKDTLLLLLCAYVYNNISITNFNIFDGTTCDYYSQLYYSDHYFPQLYYKYNMINLTKLYEDLYNNEYYDWYCESSGQLVKFTSQELYDSSKKICNQCV
jgi:hypothetical protein